jgi:exopolysaccharide production negative regulator
LISIGPINQPVPPPSVPESAASSLSALQNPAEDGDPIAQSSYAASYFGNADAQYDLARLYLKNAGTSRDDFRYGARWLGLAAQKGQYQAQALLDQMLFDGGCLPPQRARGLMWLTLAYENAGPEESRIKESYNRAMASASESDRAMALQMLEHWVQGRKD